MIDKKKVVLLGTTLVLLVGCNVFAKSKMNLSSNENGHKSSYLKSRYSNTQIVDSGDVSGDNLEEKSVKNKTRRNAKLNSNLIEEEKAALKERKESIKEMRKSRKAELESLSEEEKAALKEKKESFKEMKKSRKEKLENLSEEEKAALKEKFENLTDEEKATLKEKKASKKERKVKSETATNNQEV